jgi:hypothetical protein
MNSTEEEILEGFSVDLMRMGGRYVIRVIGDRNLGTVFCEAGNEFNMAHWMMDDIREKVLELCH